LKPPNKTQEILFILRKMSWCSPIFILLHAISSAPRKRKSQSADDVPKGLQITGRRWSEAESLLIDTHYLPEEQHVLHITQSCRSPRYKFQPAPTARASTLFFLGDILAKFLEPESKRQRFCRSMSVGLSAHFAFCLFFLLNRSEWVPVRESEIILMSVSLM